MTPFGKKILAAVAALVILGAIYGAYQYPKAQQPAGSPVGSTFNTAKTASINWTLSNGATTTSVYNSDASDRYVKNLEGGCSSIGTSYTAVTGAGLASLTIKFATTSTSAPATPFNTAGTNVMGTYTLSTSTTVNSFSSSTQALGGYASTTVWAAGSYLSFWSNATNTATCVIGVSYLAS